MRVNRTLKEGMNHFLLLDKEEGCGFKVGMAQMPRLSASRTGATCKRLSFQPSMCPPPGSCKGWATAHLPLGLLQDVTLPLIGSREDLNSMYLSESMTSRSLQLNVYQILGCKK